MYLPSKSISCQFSATQRQDQPLSAHNAALLLHLIYGNWALISSSTPCVDVTTISFSLYIATYWLKIKYVQYALRINKTNQTFRAIKNNYQKNIRFFKRSIFFNPLTNDIKGIK